jgi:hypothetical protein
MRRRPIVGPVPDWFLPLHGDHGVRRAVTALRDAVEDDDGWFVVVETRKLGARVYETTIAPGYAQDPDGPEVAVFASVDTPGEAALAHEQAVDFAATALRVTRRAERAGNEVEPPASV